MLIYDWTIYNLQLFLYDIEDIVDLAEGVLH